MAAPRGMRFIAPPSSHDYCLRLLRNFDNENFVVNTLLPATGLRKQHAAIRAFNVELARIRTTVSNEDMGHMRIAFFRDALKTIRTTSQTTLHSPVLECLSEALSTTPTLDLAPLETLVDARASDLSYPTFATLSSLATFAASLQAPLLETHASALATSPSIAPAANFAGEAIGLAVLLRGAPAHAASRLSYAPADLVRGAGGAAGEVLVRGRVAKEVFGAVAERARRSLAMAEDALGEVPCEARPAFWALALPRIYLQRLQRVDGDPFDEGLQRSMRFTYPLRLQMQLLARRVSGR